MGCGISTMEPEDASPSRRSKSNHLSQRTIVRPVNNNADDQGGDSLGGPSSKGFVLGMKPLEDEEVKGVSNEKKLKEKEEKEEKAERMIESGGKTEHGAGDDNHVKKNEEMNEEKENNIKDVREDGIIGPGSPSFREYCVDNDSVDQRSVGDFNDCDSRDSTKNGSDGDSTMRKNNSQNEKIINSNKEPEKKERRGRGFRNVIQKGKTRGKRNLLNFACYNASNASYAEGSFNKVVGKTA